MGKKKYKRIKISQLAVFNIYGDQNICNLFENVESINNDINKLKYDVSEKFPIDLRKFESRLEDKIENEVSDIYKELKRIKPGGIVEVNVNKDIVRLDSKIDSIGIRIDTLESQTQTAKTDNSNQEIKQYKGYIEQLAHLCQTQKATIEQQSKKIKSLENTVYNQNKVLSEQKEMITYLAQRVQAIENADSSVSNDVEYKKQLSFINAQAKEIKDLKSTVSKQNTLFDSLLSRIESLEKKEVVSQTPVLEEHPNEKFVFPVLSANVDLININEGSSEDSINNYLNKVVDISGIEEFLNKGTLETSHKNTYSKIFSKYKKDLNSEIKKIDVEDLDDEEKSGIIISIVGNTAKNTITSKVIPAICDRISNNYAEYRDFFEVVNNYLNSIGFYNEEIKVNDLIIDGNNSIHMETSYIKTTNHEKHGKILDIKVLPYMINYIDEDGNKATFVCKGLCSAYRFE